jgi:N-acetylglutamate synthase-like GNAT family acetyltransferase
MQIKPFEDRYRDDLIFMVLEAKDALGRVPRLNEDLLDIRTDYFDRGDAFWIAVDENDRVIGCAGFNRIDGTTEAKLRRLYVKAGLKRQGIGSALLETAEASMKENGVTSAIVHLGEPEEQWFESYAFYPKHGYELFAPRYMRKEL